MLGILDTSGIILVVWRTTRGQCSQVSRKQDMFLSLLHFDLGFLSTLRQKTVVSFVSESEYCVALSTTVPPMYLSSARLGTYSPVSTSTVINYILISFTLLSLTSVRLNHLRSSTLLTLKERRACLASSRQAT
jgi:hypothetical protein